MDLGLAGKRALISGSSSGIGSGIAEMLAVEGVEVVIHGRNVARAEAVAERIMRSGGTAYVACGDLASDSGAAQVVESTMRLAGGVDILVNNAGGATEGAKPNWFATEIEDYLETFQCNVLAAVRLIRALVPPMRERGWGRVINIGTGAAITPTSAQPDYAGAKAAMLNLTLSLSKALSRSGVTSNAVSPGMIRTEGLRSFLTRFADKRGWGDDIARAEDYVAKGSGQTVTRIGEVEDIAYAVAMLASPRSDFINGTNFHVDGGITPSLV